MAITKKDETTKADEDEEKREATCPFGETVDWCNQYWKQFEGSSKD